MSDLPASSTASLSRLIHRLGDLELCLYLQLYYWGKDVTYPKGNLLVTYGFERIARTTKEGTSRYRMAYGGGVIELHGWCISWTFPEKRGFVYVRGKRHLYFWNEAEAARAECLSRMELQSPRTECEWLEMSHLMQSFCQWLLTYEAWMADNYADGRRQEQFYEYQCLPNCMRWLPPELQLHWIKQFIADPLTTPSARRLLKDSRINKSSKNTRPCCMPYQTDRVVVPSRAQKLQFLRS